MDLTWKERKGQIEVRKWVKKCKAENKKCTSGANKIWVEDVLWIWDDRKEGFIKGRKEREQEKEKK